MAPANMTGMLTAMLHKNASALLRIHISLNLSAAQVCAVQGIEPELINAFEAGKCMHE